MAVHMGCCTIHAGSEAGGPGQKPQLGSGRTKPANQGQPMQGYLGSGRLELFASSPCPWGNSKVLDGRNHLQHERLPTLPPRRVTILQKADLGCYEAFPLEGDGRHPDSPVRPEDLAGTFIGRQPVEGKPNRGCRRNSSQVCHSHQGICLQLLRGLRLRSGFSCCIRCKRCCPAGCLDRKDLCGRCGSEPGLGRAGFAPARATGGHLRGPRGSEPGLGGAGSAPARAKGCLLRSKISNNVGLESSQFAGTSLQRGLGKDCGSRASCSIRQCPQQPLLPTWPPRLS